MLIYVVGTKDWPICGFYYRHKISALRYIRDKLNTNEKEPKSLRYMYQRSEGVFRLGKYHFIITELKVKNDRSTAL